MRPITSPALAKAEQQYGHEPIVVVRISWGSVDQWYAGKDLVIGTNHVQGKLLSVSEVSSQKKQDSVGMVGRVQLDLDDADGSIKALIDNGDVEYKTVTLYQWFQGLTDPADLMQIFQGQLVSPVAWSDDKRTVTLEVETRIKDHEIGLSVDPTGTYPIPLVINGKTDYVNVDAIDKPWPLSFGNMVHSVALKLITAPTGRLKFPFKGPRNVLVQGPTTDPYGDDRHFTLQDGDGAFFPQGVPIQVQIDGVIFGGQFNGTQSSPVDVFTVGDPNMPKYQNIGFITRGTNIPYDVFQDPDIDVSLANVAWIQDDTSIVNCYVLLSIGNGLPGRATCYSRIVRQEGNKVWLSEKITLSEDVPQGGEGEYNGIQSPTGQTVPDNDNGIGVGFHFFGPGDSILQVAKNGRIGWGVTETSSANNQVQKVEELSSILWHFQPESEVSLWAPTHEDVYIANLIPASAVVGVYANRRTRDGVQQLRKIPAQYYTLTLSDTIVVHNKTGDVTAHPTTLTFKTPLKDYEDQGWDDKVYVVMRSTVGPNTADVIKWLLDTYSSLPTDATSFVATAAQVANYPCAFTRHTKENVISLCEQVAFQARMALIVDNGVIAIKYLSTEPSTDFTFDETLIRLRTIELKFTSTEDVYTRITGRVRLSGFSALRFEKEMVYSANVAKFGLRRREIDFFIYNVQSLAQKSLDFWGGRFTNSWRTAQFTSSLSGFLLQMFDTAALAFTDTGILNTASIKTVVDKVAYNPNNDEVKLDFWLPSVAGSTAVSPFAWQSDAGDVAPADPTLKYAADAFDVQHPNGESRRRVTLGQDGGAVPAIVTDLAEAGDPSDSDIVPGSTTAVQATVVVTQYGNGYDNAATATGVAAKLDPSPAPKVDQRAVSYVNGVPTLSKVTAITDPGIPGVATGQVVKLDQYGNGYAAPPTKVGVASTAVNVEATPTVDQRVMSFNKSNRVYFDAETSKSAPAIITAFVTMSTYVVDVYQNGFDNDATGTNVVAHVLTQVGRAYVKKEPVFVILSNGKTYISSPPAALPMQDFDVTDPFTIAYSPDNLPIQYGARYQLVMVSGKLTLQQVPDTYGPIGQLICWPGAGGRTKAQWGGTFAAKVTAVGPLKVTPVVSGDGTGWQLATDLGEIPAFSCQTGVAPKVGDFVTCLAGTALGAQYVLAFQGGGSGVIEFPAKLTAYSAGMSPPLTGRYSFTEVDPSDNSTLGGGRTGDAAEFGRSVGVDVSGSEVVVIKTGGVYGSNYYFFYPAEVCVP